MTTIEILQLSLSLIGVLIAVIGLPLLYMQLRGLKKSVLSATHAAMYHQAAEFRAHLIQYPHLRKYFFDGWEIAPEDEDYSRVVTLAEVFLNYLEHIAVLGNSFGSENRPALDRFSQVAFERSPILRQHLALNRASYSDTLQRFLKERFPGAG
ncbi:MAG: hypothetical protein ACREVI_03660 [Steroidobacteraceae bacterium]